MPGHPPYYEDLFEGLNLAPEHRIPDFAMRYYGVVPALVTNNQDPMGNYRVKVRFPWLSPDDETDWIRISTVMAGRERGTYFLPEVGDEVLIAFEQGEVHRPLVIGALWNGEDPTPTTNHDGKNDVRLIKSRSGHKIIFDDKDGEERITIVDKTGKNRIVWEVKDKTITIETMEGSMGIKAPAGKLTVEAATLEVKTEAETVIASDKELHFQSADQMTWESGAKTDITAQLLNINNAPPAGAGGSAAGGAGSDRGGPYTDQGGAFTEPEEFEAGGAGGGAGGGGDSAQQADDGSDSSPAESDEPKALISAKWDKSKVEMGADGTVELSAQVDNISDGTSATITVFDRTGAAITSLTGVVASGRVSVDWSPELPDGAVPEIEFEVEADGETSRSGLLTLVDWIDLTITDPDGNVLPGAEYELVLADGKSVSGTADEAGHARHEDVYPGQVEAVRVFWKKPDETAGSSTSGSTSAAAQTDQGAGDDGASEAGASGDNEPAEPAGGDDEPPFVSIKLVDPDGTAMADAAAQVVFDSGETREVTTDGDGVLKIEDPPDGAYTVEVGDLFFEFE